MNRTVYPIIVIATLWWLFADTLRRHMPAQVAPNVIRFAHFGGYDDFKRWAGIIDDFESTHPGLHVRHEFVPGWYGRYDTKIRQQILTDSLPHVVLIQLGPFPSVAQHLASLDEFYNATSKEPAFDTIDPLALDAFSFRNAAGNRTLRAMPISGGNLAVYCNLDCFDRAAQHHGREIPLPHSEWTVEDFVRTATDLTVDLDKDGQSDQWGLWQPRWVYFLPFAWAYGARYVDDTGARWTFNDQAAENAVNLYRRLVRDDRVCPAPAEVPQLIQDLGFLTGKVGMCVNGPWFLPFLERTRFRDRIHVVPVPRGPAGRTTRITWDALALAGRLSPEERATGWKFIHYCLSARIQKRIASAGRALPARADVLPSFLNSTQTGAADMHRSVFVDGLDYSRLQPPLRPFAPIDRAIRHHLNRFVAPDASNTPAQFLADLANDPAITSVYPTALRQPAKISP